MGEALAKIRVGEMFKYGGSEFFSSLAGLFNGIFETHVNVCDILEGGLIPSKPLVVNNTRPITLLNMTRKIFSNILCKT